MRKGLTTEKIIKHTVFALLAYFITYTLSEIIIISIVGSSLVDAISLIFTSFPMMITGNILPSVLGYGAIYLCNKTINDELLITRVRLFTLLAIIGTEVIGTIIYYANVGKFVESSVAIITLLIIDSVRINKKYKKLKNPSVVVEVVANGNDIENDSLTNAELQEETVAEQISIFEEMESTAENEEECNQETTEQSVGEKIMSLITSKRIAAIISILLCITLYLTFLTTVFTNERDTYICYTTKTGASFHSATCNYTNKSAYETTVYEASRKYKPCNYCNPCVKQYQTTITERNYVIPIFISIPISAAVFLLLTYKKKEK